MKTFYSKQEILSRLKDAYNIKKDNELAELLGVSKSTLSNWVSRDSIDFDKVFSLCEHINLNWLLTGQGSKFREEPITTDVQVPDIQILHHPKCNEKKIQQQAINLYDVAAAANLKTLFDNKDQNILGEITIPDIPKCDGAVYVNGDSMYPLLKSGDIIAYKEIHNFDCVIFGEMYLVSFDMDGNDFLAVKYINRSEKENSVKLVSYNSHHDPMDIPITSINALGLVKFSIRKNTMI